MAKKKTPVKLTPAQKYAGSNYVKNHQPKLYAERLAGFTAGYNYNGRERKLIAEKAKKYDELENEIADFFVDENGEVVEDKNMLDIAEWIIRKLGWNH